MSNRKRVVFSGLAISLGLLLLVEVFVGRSDWIWTYQPRSNAGIVDVLENEVIAKAPNPEVIALGASRLRDGLSPGDLESLLGLNEGTVLNLALTGGRAFDSLLLYERNREKLSQARVAIVSVEVDDVIDGRAPSARVRRFADLDDRLAWSGHELSLLAGSLWRTYDARDQIRGLPSSIIRNDNEAPPIADDGRVVWQDEVAVGPVDLDLAPWEDRYVGADPGEGQMRYLDQLIELLQEDGLDIWVIHVPLRDSAADLFEENNAELMAHFQRVVASLDEVAGIDVPWRAGNVENLGPTGFYDYGHPSTEGAEILTKRYAQLIADD